jgi:hypothetical protein
MPRQTSSNQFCSARARARGGGRRRGAVNPRCVFVRTRSSAQARGECRWPNAPRRRSTPPPDTTRTALASRAPVDGQVASGQFRPDGRRRRRRAAVKGAGRTHQHLLHGSAGSEHGVARQERRKASLRQNRPETGQGLDIVPEGVEPEGLVGQAGLHRAARAACVGRGRCRKGFARPLLATRFPGLTTKVLAAVGKRSERPHVWHCQCHPLPRVVLGLPSRFCFVRQEARKPRRPAVARPTAGPGATAGATAAKRAGQDRRGASRWASRLYADPLALHLAGSRPAHSPTRPTRGAVTCAPGTAASRRLLPLRVARHPLSQATLSTVESATGSRRARPLDVGLKAQTVSSVDRAARTRRRNRWSVRCNHRSPAVISVHIAVVSVLFVLL